MKSTLEKSIFTPCLKVSDLPFTTTGIVADTISNGAFIDNNIGFDIHGIWIGDIVYNSTDGSHAIVKMLLENKDSGKLEIICTSLVGGKNNIFHAGDSYAIGACPKQQITLTEADGDNKPGIYERNSDNTKWNFIKSST